MRLKPSDLKEYNAYRVNVVKEPDGTRYEEVDTVPYVLEANVQPAGGRVMSEIYGERLAYMLTALVHRESGIQEKDRLCVYVASDDVPDYRVVAIKRWSTHFVVDLEKVIK